MPSPKSPIDLLKAKDLNLGPFFKSFNCKQKAQAKALKETLVKKFGKEEQLKEEKLTESNLARIEGLINSHREFLKEILQFTRRNLTVADLEEALESAMEQRDVDAMELALYRILYFTKIKL